MKRALLALIASPQNNLRVFVDGNAIYSEELLRSQHRALRVPGFSSVSDFADYMVEVCCSLLAVEHLAHLVTEAQNSRIHSLLQPSLHNFDMHLGLADTDRHSVARAGDAAASRRTPVDYLLRRTVRHADGRCYGSNCRNQLFRWKLCLRLSGGWMADPTRGRL